MQIFQPSSIKDYLIEVGRGNVAGVSRGAFGGYTTSLPADTEELIWNQGGVYTELTTTTQLYVSSTVSGDNGTILSIGMNDDYEQIIATATLNGQNQVALSSPFFRHLISIAIGPNQSDGDIYIAAASTGGDLVAGVPQTQSKIKGKMNAGKRQTWGAVYTIPAGKTARFIDFKAMSTKAKNVSVSFIGKSITDGDNFSGPPPFDVYESYHFIPWQLTFPAEEKTDIRFTGKSEDADSKILILAEMLLFDN